jgi:hypothetical protein
MPQIYISDVIDSPLETVWSVLRPFDKIDLYFNEIVKVELVEGGSGTEVGCVRRCYRADGSTRDEKLLMLSDTDHIADYAVMDSPDLPATNVKGRVRAYPITEGIRQTFIEWSLSFEPRSDTPDNTVETIEGLFRSCIAGVKSACRSRAK